MEIKLEGISKKYGSQWVFKDIQYHFKPNRKYALIGSNGAGKSTLINIIIGKIPSTRGEVSYKFEGAPISVDHFYKHLSIATTSMSLIEEFSLRELLHFHFKFRKPIKGITRDNIIDLLQLKKESRKYISNFSSGMKQRLKIGLALLTDSNILILDEPGSNLDEKSKEWYQELLMKFLGDRLLIIASNEKDDYRICDDMIDLSEFKT